MSGMRSKSRMFRGPSVITKTEQNRAVLK